MAKRELALGKIFPNLLFQASILQFNERTSTLNLIPNLITVLI
jgi:hypothetical protein